jgi:glycogen synthase
MQRNAMRQDFSWTRSAREYLRVYQEVVQEKMLYSVSKGVHI